MQLSFTRHARVRLAERPITEEEVAAVINGADIMVQRKDDCVEYTGRTAAGRRLKVVLAQDSDPYRVITVHEL